MSGTMRQRAVAAGDAGSAADCGARRLGAACAVAAALLAGCAGTPVARFHSLLAPPSVPDRRQVPTDGGREAAAVRHVAWTLAPVSVPSQVDRPQWVVRAPDGTLAVLENERWIAPLADEMRAAVAERLAQALGAEAAPAVGWRVAIAVQRFDSLPARGVRLDAAWTVGPAAAGAAAAEAGAQAPTLVCHGRFEQPVGSGYPALAAGHRQTLVRLADAVAATLAALDAGEAACPP